MKPLTFALLAAGCLALAHQSSANWMPKQYAIYGTKDYIDSGDTVQVTNSTSATIDIDIVAHIDGTLLHTIEIAPGKKASRKISEDVSVERVEVDREADNIEGLCGIDCFPAGTLVQTPLGLRDISHLAAGDSILLDRDGKLGQVAEVQESASLSLVRIETKEGFLSPSVGHAMRTVEHGWMAAGSLTGGESLLTAQGEQLPIRSIELVHYQSPEPVFNLVLEQGNAFLLGDQGILVGATAR